MTILIIGGTGQTGTILSSLLKQANQSILITSRSGTATGPYKAVKFDWSDEKTFENPFQVDSNIDRVYLVLPALLDLFTITKPFIDLAVSRGVKRFVLLSAITVPPTVGDIHKYLADIKVDYAILRPTWFHQNFGKFFYAGIRDQNQISGVAKDGRIPFISVDDIAQAAYDALISEKSPNKDYYIVGPELFSFDEVAELLTVVLGRKIVHKRLSLDEHKKFFIGSGMDPGYADYLVNAESGIANGAEEDAFNADENQKFVGKHTLREYFEANKDIWIKQ